MFEDFEFEPTVLLVSAAFALFINLAIWKFQFGEGWDMWQKIILSIAALPISYLMVNWQMNR